MTLILKRVRNIIRPDFLPAADAIRFHRKKCTKAETNGYTSDMLMCQNAKADRHNSRRSGKCRQRNMQQYPAAHGREDGYTPLHGLGCLVFSLSLAGLA